MEDPQKSRFDKLYGEPDIRVYPKLGREGYDGRDTWEKMPEERTVKRVVFSKYQLSAQFF